MRNIIILFFSMLIYSIDLSGQNKIIIGKVIDENLEAIPEATIENSDTIFFGKTDNKGNFRIDIPLETDTLIFQFIAMERKAIKLSQNCDTVDVILMVDANYDFMTARQVDRDRKRRFKKLPELHQIAYEKGLFSSQEPCYEQTFDSIMDKLKEIK
jgi:hypothetical protein